VKIAIVTDAWLPQTNGVVRTLTTTRQELCRLGHGVTVVEPAGFRTFPCPSYPEIRLAGRPYRPLCAQLGALAPDAIHIATEGPLGWAARAWCRAHGQPFTTSYHTQFPEYLQARIGLPPRASYALLRRFHGAGQRTLVATESLQKQLNARGFRNLVRWSRGVDVTLFRPGPKDLWRSPRPIWLYVGRVAVEKNLEAFLSLHLPGTKAVIGDGPARGSLEERFPNVVFTGYKHGEDLARHMAAADVFVFPSRTDTFGLVLLEALATGTPVAAFPVPGPLDVIADPAVGCLDEDLARAARNALSLDRDACRTYALGYSWQACADQFRGHLAPIGGAAPHASRSLATA